MLCEALGLWISKERYCGNRVLSLFSPEKPVTGLVHAIGIVAWAGGFCHEIWGGGVNPIAIIAFPLLLRILLFEMPKDAQACLIMSLLRSCLQKCFK